MNIYKANENGIRIYTADSFSDCRGCTQILFEPALARESEFRIVQINNGFNLKANTLRGLHFQLEPHSQAKLVSCQNGSLWSVAVDIRKGSPFFGRCTGEILSLENRRIMYIPRGFAHGYLTLEDNTLIQWCTDNEFCKEAALALRFDDPDIDGGIKWPWVNGAAPIISAKDQSGLTLKALEKMLSRGEALQ